MVRFWHHFQSQLQLAIKSHCSHHLEPANCCPSPRMASFSLYAAGAYPAAELEGVEGKMPAPALCRRHQLLSGSWAGAGLSGFPLQVGFQFRNGRTKPAAREQQWLAACRNLLGDLCEYLDFQKVAEQRPTAKAHTSRDWEVTNLPPIKAFQLQNTTIVIKDGDFFNIRKLSMNLASTKRTMCFLH